MIEFYTRNRNAVSGVALALLGGGALWAVSVVPLGLPAASDPALFPRIIAVGLIVVGLLLAAGTVLRRSTGAGELQEDAEGTPIEVVIPEELLAEQEDAGTDPKLALGLTLALALYCVSAFTLGFLTSTLAFLIGVALLLGHRRSLRSLIGLGLFAIGVTAAYYVGFFVLLSVRMPPTLLP